MKPINSILRQALVWLYLATSLLAACTTTPTVSTTPILSMTKPDTPPPTATQMSISTKTSTPFPKQIGTPTITITPDLWKIHDCLKVPSIIEWEDDWLWNYIGDIEGQGEVEMLLSFTKSNEILGFYFDFNQVREYQVSGCVEERSFTMWLRQGDRVEAAIQGEFPETDPRGHYSSSDVLKGEVIIGSIMEKTNSRSLSVYLNLSSGGAGTLEHRFRIAGVEDDTVILNASQQFLAAIANDDRAYVVQMIRFPLKYITRELKLTIQTPDSLLAQYYDVVFDAGFKERLANTFPDYLIAEGGNYLGTISLTVYGGGGISFDEHGRVTAIYNWQKPALTPSPPITPEGNK